MIWYVMVFLAGIAMNDTVLQVQASLLGVSFMDIRKLLVLISVILCRVKVLHSSILILNH
jgi:uncharacterized protein (DUF486 family)